MKIDHLFKAFRTYRQLSQRELGLLLGFNEAIAQTRVSRYEIGSIQIPINIAYTFIDVAFQCDVVYQLGDIYPRPSLLDETETAVATDL